MIYTPMIADAKSLTVQILQRARKEKTPRERTPLHDGSVKSKAPTPPKDDAGVHSGSEEGEIEED